MPICRVKSAAVDEQHNAKTNSIIRSQMVGLDLGNGFELPFRVGLGQRPPYPAVYNPYRERSEDRRDQRFDAASQPRPVESVAVTGSVVQHVERTMGSFPESPPFPTDSYMTTAPGPNKL